MQNTLPPLASNDLLCGALTSVLPETKHQSVAVFDDELALFVDASFWPVKDLSTTCVQFCGERVDSDDVEVRIVSASGPTGSHVGLVGSIEEHLNIVASYDCKNRRRIGSQSRALSIPITRYLETQNISVILAGLDKVRYSELRHDSFETYVLICH
jgi:hypothetical protein